MSLSITRGGIKKARTSGGGGGGGGEEEEEGGEWRHPLVSWPHLTELLLRFGEILKQAGGRQLGEWSCGDFERALGWARLMEDVVNSSPEGPSAEAHFSLHNPHPALSWKAMAAAQHVLLRRMLNNPLLGRCPALGRLFLTAYFDLAGNPSAVQRAIDQLIRDLQPILSAVCLSSYLSDLILSSSTISSAAPIFPSSFAAECALARLLYRKLMVGTVTFQEFDSCLQDDPGFLEIVALQLICAQEPLTLSSSASSPSATQPRDAQQHQLLVGWLLSRHEGRLWSLREDIIPRLCLAEPLVCTAYLQHLAGLWAHPPVDPAASVHCAGELLRRLSTLSRHSSQLHSRALLFIRETMMSPLGS